MISIRANTKANYHEYAPPLFCHCAYSATRQKRGILYSANSKMLGRLRVKTEVATLRRDVIFARAETTLLPGRNFSFLR